MDRNTLSVFCGSLAGLGTAINAQSQNASQKVIQIQLKAQSIWGTSFEFWHLILYAFIGGLVGWLAKEMAEYCKRKIFKK